MNAAELYDRDFAEWAVRNAELLRSGRVAEADLDHIAEEIEDMAKRERRAMQNRLARLIQHLLKWQVQPMNWPNGSTRSMTAPSTWRRSIRVSRGSDSQVRGLTRWNKRWIRAFCRTRQRRVPKVPGVACSFPERDSATEAPTSISFRVARSARGAHLYEMAKFRPNDCFPNTRPLGGSASRLSLRLTVYLGQVHRAMSETRSSSSRLAPLMACTVIP